MLRTIVITACILSAPLHIRAQENPPANPSFDSATARTHELKPHRHAIPVEGTRFGIDELRLTLTVSPTGDVVNAVPAGRPEILKLWPQLQGEVYQWKFTPFEKDGKAVTAEVKESISFLPPERLPIRHVAPPPLLPKSTVTIILQRTRCFGTCPDYTVTVSTDGIVFDGTSYVVATGKHTDTIDADKVRALAKKFVAADFYSMDPSYQAAVTDCPTYILSIAIDGQEKKVTDYVGAWVGMPAVITELEEDVDALVRTQRWIAGTDKPVP